LLIDEYFQFVDNLLSSSAIVQDREVTYDRRDKSTGFIRANIVFVDDSIVHVREFVNVMADVERLMYSYQYMSAAKELIFRYDDTDHHRSLPTHPHHKHDGSEENVVQSNAPTLAEVLDEIGLLVSR